jgi:hypothetical protein
MVNRANLEGLAEMLLPSIEINTDSLKLTQPGFPIPISDEDASTLSNALNGKVVNDFELSSFNMLVQFEEEQVLGTYNDEYLFLEEERAFLVNKESYDTFQNELREIVSTYIKTLVFDQEKLYNIAYLYGFSDGVYINQADPYEILLYTRKVEIDADIDIELLTISSDGTINRLNYELPSSLLGTTITLENSYGIYENGKLVFFEFDLEDNLSIRSFYEQPVNTLRKESITWFDDYLVVLDVNDYPHIVNRKTGEASLGLEKVLGLKFTSNNYIIRLDETYTFDKNEKIYIKQ